MPYTSLLKIYYKNMQHLEIYEREYEKRIHSPSSRQFEISIRQAHRKTGYPAFYCYTEDILLTIQHIYESFQNIQHISQRMPKTLMEQYAYSCLIDEVQATNDIEGVRSTKKQIKNVLEDQPVPHDVQHLSSVIDKYKKIISHEELHFATCQDIRMFYDDFVLREVLQEHPDYAPDGKVFRADSVEIASKTAQTRHIGIAPEETIISYMDQALRILHDPGIPLLIRLSVFHYLFEYIHPFYDGNGRTGRFIVSYYLAQEFNVSLASRLSIVINKNKNKYYKLFEETNSERNRGDLTPFILSFLSFIETAAAESVAILARKEKQWRAFQEKLDSILGRQDTLTRNLYDLLLQASAFYGLGITMESMMKLTGKTRATVKSRLDNIPGDHLVVNTRVKPYHYKLNMSLFQKEK